MQWFSLGGGSTSTLAPSPTDLLLPLQIVIPLQDIGDVEAPAATPAPSLSPRGVDALPAAVDAAALDEALASPPALDLMAPTSPKAAAGGDAPANPIAHVHQATVDGEEGSPSAQTGLVDLAHSLPSAPAGGDAESGEGGSTINNAPRATPSLPATEPQAFGEPAAPTDGLETQEVDVAALVAPAVPIKQPRRSTRTAARADEHTLHKAERLAAKRNLEPAGTLSFSSFTDSHIISNLGRVGINLGSSGVAVIKNLEVDRLVLCANQKKNSSKSKAPNIDSGDERDDRLEAILSHACGNPNENMLDVENDQILDLSPLRRKKKYNSAKNTKKGKLPKKPKTPSKINIK